MGNGMKAILRKLSKTKIGYLEAIVSIVINTSLFGLKLWAGLVSHSVAMIADAWHTLSDSLTSMVVMLGFRLSSKPADQEHPFGHGRAELVASIVIGTLLVVVGVNFTKESINRLLHFKSVSYPKIAIIVFVISTLLKEGLAQFSFYLGKMIKSTSLVADGWHHRSDAIASFLIVVGAFLSRHFWWIDGVLGIFVSLLIIYAAYHIVRKNTSDIIGEALSENLIQEISQIVYHFSDEISDVHHFHLHKYGEHSELTFHIRLNPKISIESAHELTRNIESLLQEKYNYHVTIHVEPEK